MNMLNTNLTLLKQNTGFVNKRFVTRKKIFTKITELLYFIEHSAHIISLKMMLKYCLRTILKGSIRQPSSYTKYLGNIVK